MYKEISLRVVVRSLTILSIFVLVSTNFLTHSLPYMDFFYNSDGIYLSAIFEDIFNENGRFVDWNLSAAPYFFPDMALMFTIKALIENTYYSNILFSLIQIAITILLAFLILKAILEEEYLIKRSPIWRRFDVFLAFLLVTVVSLLIPGINHAFILIVTNVHHFGNLLNCLLLVLGILYFLQGRGIGSCLFLFIISFLGTSSDLLFVVSGAVPSVLALFVCVTNRKLSKVDILRILCFIGSGILAGLLIKVSLSADAASAHILRGTDLGDLIKQFLFLDAIFKAGLESYPAFILYSLFFYGMVAWALKKSIQGMSVNSARLYLYSFIILSPIITFAAIITNGTLTVGIEYLARYFPNFYWFPIIFSWLVYDLYDWLRGPLFRKMRTFSLSVLLVVCTYVGLPRGEFYGEYYPPIIQCLDKGLDEYEQQTGLDLKNGIAGYWHARPLTEFSKRNLRIPPIVASLSPSMDNNNPRSNLYTSDSTYDFAVLEISTPGHDSPKRELIEEINGVPIERFSCRAEQALGALPAEVLIYGDNKLRVRRFIDAGDTYTWRACELALGGNALSGESCAVSSKGESQAGVVTFGPYESLPQGQYQFDIQYLSPDFYLKDIGSWNVLIMVDKGRREPLQHGKIIGTNNNVSNISGSFTVSDRQNNGLMEIRTMANSNTSLTVFKITLTKVA